MTEKTQPQAILAAIQRHPVTTFYAMLLTAHLAYAIGREDEYPGASCLISRLEKIEETARCRWRSPRARQWIGNELSDLRTFGLLANGDARAEAALSPLSDPFNLPCVAERARDAVARWARRPGKLTDRPRRQGRGKFYPDPASGPNALEFCALIVSIAWHKDAGVWPGQRNRMAATISELLWLAAGGPAHGVSPDGALTAWRRHGVAARRYLPPHRAGALVERMLDRALERLLPSVPRRQPPRDPEARRALYNHPRSRAEAARHIEAMRANRRTLLRLIQGRIFLAMSEG
jgi:hypothetical protein